MTDVSDANRFAPPRATVTDLPPTGAGHALAGRGARLAAAMLDGFLVSILTVPIMIATGVSLFAADTPPSFWTLLLAMSPGYVVAAVVQGWFLHVGGQTLGKKIMGLRIVRADGSRAGFARLFFLRAGLAIGVGFIPLLGALVSLVDMLLIFRDSRQCLHDQVADTIVVSADSSKHATLAAVRAATAAVPA